MESEAFDVLAHRVGRLERECRLWRRAVAVTLLGALSLVVGGAATQPSDEVKAKRLVIQDREDSPTGIILSAQDGIASLTFFSEGQEKIALGTAERGSPMLSFADAGKSRLMLGLSQSGVPVLNLNDEDQRRRVSLGIFPKVGPMISVLDADNKVIFRAP